MFLNFILNFFNGNLLPQVGIQVLVVVVTIVFSFVLSYIIGRVVDATIGLRVTEKEEIEGLDITLHEERGYVLSE